MAAAGGQMPFAANAAAMTAQTREMAEAVASVQMAKMFPRDVLAARDRILNACTRPGLAEGACYTYARGGQDVTGPSIRLAEAIAQNWGNISFGIRELDQRNGESTCEAFAWDQEANTRQVKVFQVPHVRYTKGGAKRLTDPRDIYELIANNGARRLRACILGVIPGDIVEEAVKACEATVAARFEATPDRIKAMLQRFEELGVDRERIEVRIQCHVDAIKPAQLVQLGKIYNSIKDGMSKAEDWFPIPDKGGRTGPTGAVPTATPRRGLRAALGIAQEPAEGREETRAGRGQEEAFDDGDLEALIGG